MQVTIGTRTFFYPNSADELTLGAWIDFVRLYGTQLDQQADAIQEMEQNYIQTLSAMQLYAERSFAVAAFFSGLPIEEAKAEFPVPETTRLYREEFVKCFRVDADQRFYLWAGREYFLPEPRLTQASAMTFGEVIDSKAMLHNAKELEWTRWELIQMLCAIFLRERDEPYRDEYGHLEGDRRDFMQNLPIGAALIVSAWYEGLNNFLEAAFTIFQESSLKSGKAMKRHFEHWGWVNFLKMIAKTKVFDIPGSGMNSVQCARASRAFDVLMYASEEKEYGEALSVDLEAKSKKK